MSKTKVWYNKELVGRREKMANSIGLFIEGLNYEEATYLQRRIPCSCGVGVNTMAPSLSNYYVSTWAIHLPLAMVELMKLRGVKKVKVRLSRANELSLRSKKK